MVCMKQMLSPLAIGLVCATAASAADSTLHTWKKLHLTPEFWGEGAHAADINKDGKLDVVSGPYWYAGPDFKTRHEYAPTTRNSPAGKAPFTRKTADGKEESVAGFEGGLGTKNAYSDNFFTFTGDINGDGWADVIVLGFPGLHSWWFENPQGKPGHWTRHVAVDVTDNESPTFADITGDGKPELIFSSGGFLGYATPDAKNPTNKWTFHKISPKGPWQKFTHGLGLGDVNGDGRMDLLEKDGWWEQPASLTGDPEWKFHKTSFGAGGAQMHVYDVNGDGRNDIVTSLVAHGYGLAWFEQLAEKDEQGSPKFKSHTFVNKEPKENRYGVAFSQPHAMDLVDMDGDGLKDLVTGKRFWAHGPAGDPEPNAPAVLYWFKLVRNADKSVDWVPHLIDNNSGVGTQVLVVDVNGDKLPDIVVGNKKGTFVHLHQAKSVSKAEWEKAQPKPVEAK